MEEAWYPYSLSPFPQHPLCSQIKWKPTFAALVLPLIKTCLALIPEDVLLLLW